jgi:hypothetical protein
MSRVTVVPIAVAASATGRTSSSARSWPSGSDWPLGLGAGGDVLAQVVERDQDAVAVEGPHDGERVVEGLPGDEPVDHPPGRGVTGDQAAQTGATGRGQERLLQDHETSRTSGWWTPRR